MELNQLVTICASIIALIISLVTLIRSRKSDHAAIRRSHIDMKYEGLALMHAQHLVIFELKDRARAVLSGVESEDALFRSIRPVANLLAESDEKTASRIDWLSGLDTRNVSVEEEAALRNLRGLLKERDSILITTRALLSEAEQLKELRASGNAERSPDGESRPNQQL